MDGAATEVRRGDLHGGTDRAKPGPAPSVLTATLDPVAGRDLTPPPATEPLRVLYVVVRGDISHGAQVAQAGHAASEASGYPPTIMVALQVPDEHALRRVAAALGDASLAHKLIVEDDGAHAGQAMAIGIEPTLDRRAVRKVVSALPLVK